MEPDFWIARWKEGRIGFHEGRPNELLVRRVARLGERRRVLVPLCGKAEDLAYLAGQGHEVVGVELVEDAVKAFFDEHGATPSIERRGALTAYSAGNITILAGDFFEAQVEGIDALYDRAAIIALPEPLRRRYAGHVRRLVAPGSTGLVVTLEYPQERFEGPPFSVTEAELRAHYLEIELLEQVEAGGRFKEQGIPAREAIYAVRF